jgi:hypothetical protein
MATLRAVRRPLMSSDDVIFEVTIQKLEIIMGNKFTAPEIIAALGKRIRQWCKHCNDQTIDQTTHLLLGPMSTKWMDAQQKYL